VPKDRRGFVGELRLLAITRRSAVKARTQASNQIKAFLLDADDELRARLHGLRKARFGRAAPPWHPPTPCAAPWLPWAAGGWPWTLRSASWKLRSLP